MTPSFQAATLRTGLSEHDLDMLGLSGHQMETIPKGAEVSASPLFIHILFEGWACRYKNLRNGLRQVIGLNLSGEICDLDKMFFPVLACSVQAISPCRVARAPIDQVKMAVANSPAIGNLLWSLTTLENIAITELAINLGRRAAHEKMAWFFCHLEDRLRPRGQMNEKSFRMEIVQADIADLLGLSLVHTNRSLQGLRSEGLISSSGSHYTILDSVRLRAMAGYETDASLECPIGSSAACDLAQSRREDAGLLRLRD